MTYTESACVHCRLVLDGAASPRLGKHLAACRSGAIGRRESGIIACWAYAPMDDHKPAAGTTHVQDQRRSIGWRRPLAAPHPPSGRAPLGSPLRDGSSIRSCGNDARVRPGTRRALPISRVFEGAASATPAPGWRGRTGRNRRTGNHLDGHGARCHIWGSGAVRRRRERRACPLT